MVAHRDALYRRTLPGRGPRRSHGCRHRRRCRRCRRFSVRWRLRHGRWPCGGLAKRIGNGRRPDAMPNCRRTRTLGVALHEDPARHILRVMPSLLHPHRVAKLLAVVDRPSCNVAARRDGALHAHDCAITLRGRPRGQPQACGQLRTPAAIAASHQLLERHALPDQKRLHKGHRERTAHHRGVHDSARRQAAVSRQRCPRHRAESTGCSWGVHMHSLGAHGWHGRNRRRRRPCCWRPVRLLPRRCRGPCQGWRTRPRGWH
mmetsp:Transcript_85689/g.239465  ORF Transcript_85689/g.239465 Transcript_85689/m.239465 type:complete len:260 (+) Transcript_85689:1005-1784(+)